MTITIYSKDNCAQCSTAINLCKAKGADHQVLKLGVDYTVEEIKAFTGEERISMPVIFIGEDRADLPGLISHLKS